jgi:hypothetical protein
MAIINAPITGDPAIDVPAAIGAYVANTFFISDLNDILHPITPVYSGVDQALQAMLDTYDYAPNTINWNSWSKLKDNAIAIVKDRGNPFGYDSSVTGLQNIAARYSYLYYSKHPELLPNSPIAPAPTTSAPVSAITTPAKALLKLIDDSTPIATPTDQSNTLNNSNAGFDLEKLIVGVTAPSLPYSVTNPSQTDTEPYSEQKSADTSVSINVNNNDLIILGVSALLIIIILI